MARCSRLRSTTVFALLTIASAVSGCAAGGARGPDGPAQWRDAGLDPVSRPAVAAGVAAVTALAPGGHLRTVAVDVTSGHRLWTRPAVIAGRPAEMGVAPPVVAGPPGHPVVAAVERRDSAVALVGRDARTGARLWTHRVGTTLGPYACGAAVCVTEHTARRKAAFALLDATTGRTVWSVPGVAEVEWADARHVVLFRMAAHPMIEAREPATGRLSWSFPVERALGGKVDLSGGWSFGSLGGELIGYVGPYRARPDAALPAFGFFALRLDDGAQRWAAPRLVRVFPGAHPAVALIAREVDAAGRYGAFTQLDPRTGRAVARVGAGEPAAGDRRAALSADLSTLGLLAGGRPSPAYDLRTGHMVAGHVTAWSFCTARPAPLRISGQPGFYAVAALCAYDMKTGRRVRAPGPPPGWYTGSSGGWRVWRDDRGGLHGVHDAGGTVPGMYG